MTTIGTAHSPAPHAVEELHLVSVLTQGLPVELGTPAAPARYTVPAVFCRQVSAAERERIEDPTTARSLHEHAGGDLTLTVSDRRLLIGDTSLDELRDGLAAALAGALRDIGHDLSAERGRRIADAAAREAVEHDREAAVAAAAAAVRFE